MIQNSIVKPNMILNCIMWPDETFFERKKSGVETILVCQLAGVMGFYDAARVIFNDGRDDLIVPLHRLDNFTIKATQQESEE